MNGPALPDFPPRIAGAAALLVGFVALGCQDGQVPRSGWVEPAAAVPEAPDGPSTAVDDQAFQAHLAALEQRLTDRGFHAMIERPFVVIGDESAATVAHRARRTVRWAVRLLQRDFFPKSPDHIIDIWLFKNRASYLAHTMEFFGERPSTPFGYYAPGHRALIMNIKTGGGTLVHEIVHPLVAANFPSCPAWLNEGLGSLFEQCAERDGKICGLPNWRLKGLQQALREGSIPSFAALTATSDEEFYTADPGTHYAQARYLCYYLQEQGVLREYYRRFLKNHRADPTGYGTLRRVLKLPELPSSASADPAMEAFEKRWRGFVLQLTY